jgi:cyclopropane fatty-acyl-phospholipid synthase-like methyltransferase
MDTSTCLSTPPESIYVSGAYLASNPTYHVEQSPWKARHILAMIRKHQLPTGSLCEVGCGAGEILRQLQGELPPETVLTGYDISPQAIALARERENDRLHFHCEDLLTADVPRFDLTLCMDVIEHVEDYFSFVRQLRTKAQYTIFHVPLQMCVWRVLRPSLIVRHWQRGGHLHYFLKDTLLLALKQSGCEVVDYCYTAGAVDTARTLRSRLNALARRAVFRFAPDFSVRLFGGYSLLVLVK